MFPLEFPLTVLSRTRKNSIVFDPFCGRGTANYAAHTLGIRSYGFDSSQIAVTIAKAKLATTSQDDIFALVDTLLGSRIEPNIPESNFWRWAYHPDTLRDVCKLRTGLLRHEDSDAAIMLRAIILGCLHGPLTKDASNPSYFSNQMPRTFASKPAYSVRYWKQRNMKPRYVDVRVPIRKKTSIVLKHPTNMGSFTQNIQCVDSRKYSSYRSIDETIDLVISSPPYYGMRTYVQDQWLRHWFIGGPDSIEYDASSQVDHLSPEDFSQSLTCVWDNIYNIASNQIRMVIRFGGLASRKSDYDKILRESFFHSAGNWYIYLSRNAGSASKGRRQADAMGHRVLICVLA